MKGLLEFFKIALVKKLQYYCILGTRPALFTESQSLALQNHHVGVAYRKDIPWERLEGFEV